MDIINRPYISDFPDDIAIDIVGTFGGVDLMKVLTQVVVWLMPAIS